MSEGVGMSRARGVEGRRRWSRIAPWLAAVSWLGGCGARPLDDVGVVRGALANQPGVAGGQCGFVEELANGDVLLAIKFPVAQAYVEVFSKKNGTQNIAQAMTGALNADGSFTYRAIVPASTYASSDKLVTRFYSYAPSQPGVFTPGPTDATSLPTFVYGAATCTENLACTGFLATPTYAQQLTNGNLQFSVTLPANQQFVEVFVQRNDVQIIAQNIVGSGVANPDGSKTYSLVSAASNYKANDRVLARFYSYKASSPGVYTPGPTDNVWAPLLVYNQTTTCGAQCAQQTCSAHGTCVSGSSSGQIACSCAPGYQGSSCSMSSFPPPAVLAPDDMPVPPQIPGCYFYDANGWHPDACAPDGYVLQRFGAPIPPLNMASNSFVDGMGTFHLAPPIVAAQSEILFPVASGDEANQFRDAHGVGGCPSTGSDTTNQWGIQGNTNLFTGNNKDQDWVQFTLQSDGKNNAICVWNVDTTKNTAADYHSMCYMMPAPQRSGPLQPFDAANIRGFIDPTSGMLNLVAQVSWAAAGAPTHYAAVNTDEFGLAGNWVQYDGEILGLSCGSNAQFNQLEAVTRSSITSCSGDTDADSPLCGAPILPLKNNVSLSNMTNTGETNNLTQIPGGVAVDYPNDQLAVVNFTTSTTGTCIDPKHVYVRDRLDDLGGQPSNLNGQAFWESPDIYVVPHSATPVDIKTDPTETLLTPGAMYDAWIRVHNELGCAPVTGAKALVYIADPSALSTQWVSVTGTQYLSGTFNPTGLVGPGAPALLGPFPFMAPPSGFGNGHKCLLATVIADGEAAPADTTNAPKFNQVAQRNVQFSSCAFPLNDSTGSDGLLTINLTVTPVSMKPSLTALPDVEITFDDADGSWGKAWSAQPGSGTDFAVSSASGKTTIRLGVNSVTMAPVPLANGTTHDSIASVDIPANTADTTLAMTATLADANGKVLVMNGGSCDQPTSHVIP